MGGSFFPRRRRTLGSGAGVRIVAGGCPRECPLVRVVCLRVAKLVLFADVADDRFGLGFDNAVALVDDRRVGDDAVWDLVGGRVHHVVPDARHVSGCHGLVVAERETCLGWGGDDDLDKVAVCVDNAPWDAVRLGAAVADGVARGGVGVFNSIHSNV
jgi:hypothetical protein